MKHIIFISILLAPLFVMAQETTTVNKIPDNFEDFKTLRDELATTPEGGATAFIVALIIYRDNPDLGKKCLTITIDKKGLRKDPNGYKGYAPLKQDMTLIKRQFYKNSLIINSYIKGSSPKNGYKISLPYQFIYTSNAYSGDRNNGRFKVFVACSGADSPRPITMIKNNRGLWKASAWSSIVLGIKPVPEDDDL